MAVKKQTARAPEPRWVRRPEERPREILAAALRLFASKGYTATTLVDIANAAGVTKGTVYYYFRNKQTLLARLAEVNDREAVGELEAIVRGNPGPVSAQLRLVLRRGFAEPRDESRRQLRVVYVGLHSDAPRLFAHAIQQTLIRAWSLIVKLIERGKATGEFRQDADAQVAARVFTAGLVVQMLWRQTTDLASLDPFDDARMVDSTIELFLHSLRPAVRIGAAAGRRMATES